MLVDVQSEIDALPPHERDVADLIRRWSIEEVAGIVGIDEETAKARLTSACEKIAREFAESEGYELKAKVGDKIRVRCLYELDEVYGEGYVEKQGDTLVIRYTRYSGEVDCGWDTLDDSLEILEITPRIDPSVIERLNEVVAMLEDHAKAHDDTVTFWKDAIADKGETPARTMRLSESTKEHEAIVARIEAVKAAVRELAREEG